MDAESRAKLIERSARTAGRSSTVLDDMRLIAENLEALRGAVSEADPSGGVGRMMHCSWFGELTLAFPKPESIRVPLVPSDDKTSLTGHFTTIVLHVDHVGLYR